MGKARIPGDFPQKPVGIGKVPRISTPIRSVTGLDDPATRGGSRLQQSVHLGHGPNVVREDHPREPAGTPASAASRCLG